MATLSSILAWWIPWTEEPGGLQSKSQTRLKWLSTHAHTHISLWARRHILPTPEPMPTKWLRTQGNTTWVLTHDSANRSESVYKVCVRANTGATSSLSLRLGLCHSYIHIHIHIHTKHIMGKPGLRPNTHCCSNMTNNMAATAENSP